MNKLSLVAAALLALVALHLGTAEAKVFQKCELASILLPELQSNQTQLNHTEAVALLAKVICHLNETTQLNSSAITPVRPQAPPPPPPPPPHRRGRSLKRENSHSHSAEEKKPVPAKALLRLGLFQLLNKVVCEDGMNLCKMNCSKLIDDDITDDIQCVKKLFVADESGEEHYRSHHKHIFDSQCFSSDLSSYLSACSL